jgi:cytochrome P450
MRPIFRLFLANRLPEIKKLRQRERKAAEFFEPLLRQRRHAEKHDPNWEKPSDAMQWMMDYTDPKNGPADVAKLAALQLQLAFAAVHTTTITAINILYTLAVTPEYFETLRDEIRTVLVNNDGVLKSRALAQLEKLDSYMKEVLRLYNLELGMLMLILLFS